MSTRACPPTERLRAFAQGDLPSHELDALAGHVQSCDACGVVVDAAANDGLSSELAQLGTRALDSAGEPVVPEELARSAKRARRSDAPTEDPGARTARSLKSGPVRLERFELMGELGHGSFGWVFRARDTELGRMVALKLLRSDPERDPDEQARFLREARSAAQLDHPGIVRLYEAGRTEDGASFLVTELVEGATLARRLEHGRFEPRTIARWVAELADACAYAHAHGVVHRDLKPSNVLIDTDGHPHLSDFGLAKLTDAPVTATPRGEVMGTPAYMSPEQARDSGAVDARSDVYSLGVILYEGLTGGRPFQGDRRELLLAVLEDEPASPRELDESVPRDLETICLRAMAKGPSERYATAADLAADLRRYLAGEPVRARPLTRLARVRRWARRNPLAAAVLIAVIVGSGVGWAYLANLADGLVWSTAQHSAELQADVLEEVNEFYSELVDRLDPDTVPITHEWATTPGAMPLPATFTIAAGDRIAELESGVRVRLYSDEPFPWRTDGGPRDAFERRALAALRASPEETYVEQGEFEGRPAVRLAVARRMEESCLRCHNNHPETPRDDWQLGDVRGVLEIVRPIDKAAATTGRALRGTFLLASVTTLGLAVLGGVIAMSRRRVAT